MSVNMSVKPPRRVAAVEMGQVGTDHNDAFRSSPDEPQSVGHIFRPDLTNEQRQKQKTRQKHLQKRQLDLNCMVRAVHGIGS